MTGMSNYFLRLRYCLSCFPSLEAYGAKVDSIIAEFGTAVAKSEIEKALKAKKYKAVTFTHVDTSTGTPFLNLQMESLLTRVNARCPF